MGSRLQAGRSSIMPHLCGLFLIIKKKRKKDDDVIEARPHCGRMSYRQSCPEGDKKYQRSGFDGITIFKFVNHHIRERFRNSNCG